jgi:uncharacterized protein
MRTITLEEHMTTHEFQQAVGNARPADSADDYMQMVTRKLLDLGEGRIADMDASGIDLQVLSLAALGFDKLDAATATSLARDTNDKLDAAVHAHPKRFAAFATLGMHEPEKAAAEFERCVQKLGFKGALINGTVGGQFLDHACFSPVFEVAQALDVPIYLHPAPPPSIVQQAYYGNLADGLGFFLSTAAWGWHSETALHSLRLMVSGLFDRLPKLKIIIGHMGENLPFSIARADSVLMRSTKHLKRRVTEYFQQHFYITTSGYFTNPPFLCTLQVVGSDRILFSVDYPFSPNTAGRNFLNNLQISSDDMEKIAHKNAELLLKL